MSSVVSSKVVHLSSGPVTVGRMKWRAYKAIKSKLLDAVSKHLPMLLSKAKPGEPAIMGFPSSVVVGVAETVASLLSDFDEEFLRGCVVDNLPVDGLEDVTVAERAELMSVARELNPLDELMEFEGNSFAPRLCLALWGKIPKGKAPTGSDTSGDAGSSLSDLASGGSMWSPPSAESTDGPSAT